MKCFYHMDLDGKCAAAIVYKFYKRDRDYKKSTGEKCDFIGINYNHVFPYESIKPGELVVIVDFSLQKRGGFDRLLNITKNVIWIDHHKTAIEKHKYLEGKVKGIRRDGISGCELTWEYFYPTCIGVPRIVKLLGDYDIWAFKYGDNSNFLQAGIRLHPTNPENDKWVSWLNLEREGQELNGEGYTLDGSTSLLEQGKVALKYRNNYYKSLAKSWSFEADFEGLKAICCNAGSVSSQLFDSLEKDYDIKIAFIFDGSRWSCSLYTQKDNIDVSQIAKKYGGGGHKGAAGFTIKKLPFHICQK